MPSRRAYLCTLGTLGLAGCTDSRTAETPTASPTNTATGTATAEPTQERPTVELTAASVAYSVRYVVNYDHNGIYTAEDRQFVFLTVDADNPRSAFSLVADGGSFPATTFRDGEPHYLGASKRAYRRDGDPYEPGRSGWLCFVVPDHLDSMPTLRLDGDEGTWEWPVEGLKRATMPPPAWEFEASIPERVPPNATFDIEVSATNVGEGPGRFRGAVNFKNLSYHPETVGLSLAPGESGTAPVEAESGDAGQTFTYGVRTAAGDIELAVDIVAETDTATPTATETE
jgi:hypothetical protein